MAMPPFITSRYPAVHYRNPHQADGKPGLLRAVGRSLIFWTAWVTILFPSLILFQSTHHGSGGVAALSCATCDPILCPSTSDCPGSLVMDICNCCKVCARARDQKCGGMFGILGQCDKGLHCFIRHVDGQPITGEEEGICKETPEVICKDNNCPPVHEPDLCPPDSFLATTETKHEAYGSTDGGNNDNDDSIYHNSNDKANNEASSESNNLYLLPEQTSFCACNTSSCDVPACATGSSLHLARNGTGIPGSCCDVYICKKLEVCQSVICPPYDEEKCPDYSIRLPSTWAEDHCCELQQRCVCLPEDKCQPIWCPEGFQVQITSRASRLPGSCCDSFRCLNESGQTCSYNGKEMKNGETWQIDKCKSCECRDGLNRCKDKACKNLSCTWMVIPEGECCPVCRGCVSDSGDLYNDSAVWKENDCTACTCKNGHAQCQAEMCAVHCANPRHVPGQCCPVCPDEDPASDTSLCAGIESCNLSCKHGLEQTQDGCFICKCKEETCHLDCQFGLKADIEGDPVCECRGAEDRCPPWEEEQCEKKCEYGYKRSRDGCIKCKCKKCPQFNCTKRCIHGHILNDEGCALCKCKEMALPELITSNSEPENLEGKACISMYGSRHENGESWNDGCRLCSCHNGVEMCSLIACPAPLCSHPVFRTGDCCPTCLGLTVASANGDKELCESSQGHYYVEGEIWQMDACTHCICHGGTILCEVPSCPPVLCHHPVKPEGQCCATCRGNEIDVKTTHKHHHHCISTTGNSYKHEETWQSTPCQSCACMNGQIHCYNQMCPVLNCNRTVQKKGHCCPTCVEVSAPKICIYSEVTYESGERWEGDNCSQCLCSAGRTECFPLVCPHLDCNILIRKSGQCCPECYNVSKLHSHGERVVKGDTNSHNKTAIPHKVSTVDGNIVGFAVLGVLVFVLAVAIVFMTWYLMSRRHHSKFRLRPKSTNLDLHGQMPFIPEQPTKIVNTETQYLEKLCPAIASEKGKSNRASNDYTEMLFGDQTKDNFKGNSENFLTSVNS